VEEKKKGILAWIKAHRKELIIAGISVTALVGIILCLKNRDSIEALWKSLSSTVKESPTKAPKVSRIALEKIKQSSVTVADVINPTEISVMNTSKTFHDPFEVSDHIRNLHEGWCASAKKITEAEAMGIILKPGQTLVDGYIKGSVAA
jgi:hypothetical protein